MEWLWALPIVVILFGPILWAFTLGRRHGAPTEDRDGSTGYAAVIKDRTDIESFGGRG